MGIANGRPKTPAKPETMEDGLAFGIVNLSFRKLMSVNRLDLNIKCFIYQYFFSFFYVVSFFWIDHCRYVVHAVHFHSKMYFITSREIQTEKHPKEKGENHQLQTFSFAKTFGYNFTRYFC